MISQRLSIPFLALTSLAATAGADVVVLVPSQDNTLYEVLFGDVSNGLGAYIFAGKNALGDRRRAVLAFDVAGQVPAGATIDSVTLTLHVSQTIAPVENVSLHRLVEDWGEGTSNAPASEGGGTTATPGDATWLNTFYNNQFWANPGGDFVAGASAASDVGGIGTYPTWTSMGMVADVQGWLDGPSANFGWLVKNTAEGSAATAKRFDSRNHSSSSVRPKLEIVYTVSSCSQSSFCSATPNSTGGAAVITANGACTVASNNFVLSAAPIPANQFGVFYYGATRMNGGAGVPFGNGTLCIASPVNRLDVVQAAGNVLMYALDFTSPPTPAGLITAGSTWHFSAWFRDPAAGGSNFDLSDALTVTFQ
ncbi:MAG: DNRLRE domain-containing protein [Planctomycetota bacterium]|nr:MAG: DNRLRE domain-containing protein [Planctomycetota bacterium]